MTKRRLRSNRFLPRYVSSFRDRHGKEHLRFRRAGYAGGYFTAPLGTEEFREEYRKFNTPETANAVPHQAASGGALPGSVGDLRRRYYALPSRLGPTATTQEKIRSVLDRGFFNGREARPVKDIRFDHIEAIIAKRRVKSINAKTGRHEGGIEAARKLRKELVRLFAFASKLGMIEKSPMEDVARVNAAPGERSKGFHSWTEAEITTYRQRHSLGTMARLALEIILWTDQRGVDTMHLGRQHIRDGRFEITQSKTGAVLKLPIAPQLLEAIVAMPPSRGNMCFIVNAHGRPFSRKGFGNKFRQWCDEAKLPHCTAHGLRKATLRRMAELEMPNKTMKSVSGHVRDDEIELYTRAANQARLARQAIEQLSEWENSPPEEREDMMAKTAMDALNRWESEGLMSNLPDGLDIKSA